MSTTIQPRRPPPPRPPNHLLNNSNERQHRQRNSVNVSSLLRDRQRQQHLQHQQKIISKNIIIETWKKVFGGGYFASMQKNKIVSMNVDVEAERNEDSVSI